MPTRPVAAFALLAIAAAAQAQPLSPPPPQNVVSLSATATVEVTKDVLSIAFTTTREGADAGVVQGQLKQAVEGALAEVKKVAKAGQIDVQTGNFSLYPRYAPKGGISGWQGSAEVLVEGKDVAGIAQLAARVQTMTIGRVGFTLSREAREKVDADVTAQAIARFRTRAEFLTKQFGFGSYTIREVSVTSNDSGPIAMPLMRAQASRALADEPLPVEAGKANVTATVGGSVVMSTGR
jgi:predicted secreted protein